MGVYNQDQSPLMTSAALKEIQLGISGGDFSIVDVTTLGYPLEITLELIALGLSPGVDCFVYKVELYIPDCYIHAPFPESCGGVEWAIVSALSGWSLEVDISVIADHSHIDRTRTEKKWRGGGGVIGSNELVAADTWAPSPNPTAVYTFGSIVCTCDWAGSIPAPSDQIWFGAILHKAATGTIVYGKWSDIEIDNVDLQLDALEDPWPGRPTVTVGRGANLEIEQRGAWWVGDTAWNNSIAPGYMADFTELGLADWQGSLAHDARYDPVIVWVWDGRATCPTWQVGGACAPPPGSYPAAWASDGGLIPAYDYGDNPLDIICPFCGIQLRPNGMNKEPWVGAAWPDTSETDWTGVGAFADGSAAPLPISEVHSIFNPYVQQIHPGWGYKTGYVREFWFGGLAWLYDRKSLRTNLIDVA